MRRRGEQRLCPRGEGLHLLFSPIRTVHQTHNSEITFDWPTEATAVWSMEDWHVYPADDSGVRKTMHGYGFYHEKWEFVSGEWKLARMELRRQVVFDT
ncbi:MAG: nuclear transport factor 2 family protein [Burkholderia gladioli]